ncbi:hypothetical protein ASE14_16650 [Agromyces sp. Root81]|uniref:glycoside hydrolase family 3 protein n=1 Tax=Agromyces sp. Root81 TaxID=1736601 RepID=UPI000701EDB9|nr:glycoside hydrolase family 3 C-terminal domain-containing protein [Agromyces sp. Root81]KRC59364.1 hypothetical protein ASE14_16650 [Agromyces sp. Root81]
MAAATDPMHAIDLDADIAGRIARLSLEQKVALVSGATFWSTAAIPEIGLREMVMSDGPSGVRGERWTEHDPSASLPNATAIAATFDADAAETAGRIIGGEARRKGVRIVLGPTMNLHRSPLAGRNFESFGEDPALSGAIAAGVVRGIQSAGVAATAKHFVGNDSETERMTADVVIDRDTLERVYAAPFAAAVEAGAWAVMSSYNGINGTTGTESPLLDELLRHDWGFDGVVISDWDAVRSVVSSAKAGTDLAMPGPATQWAEGLAAAVRAGDVDVADLDRRAARLLRLAARVGALDDLPAAGPDPAARASTTPAAPAAPAAPPAPAPDDPELREALTALSVQSMVLLENRDATLPMPRSTTPRIAVIGAAARRVRIGGGGSATVVPPHVVSFLDGVRAEYPGSEVRFATGCDPFELLTAIGTESTTSDGRPGIEVAFLDRDGATIATEQRLTGALVYGLGFPDGVDEASVATIVASARVREPGVRRIGYAGVGRFTLEVDGRVVSSRTLGLEDPDPITALSAPPQHVETLELPDRPVLIELSFEPEAASIVAFRLGLDHEARTPEALLDEARALAEWADAAVVTVVTTETDESEGFDRTTLAVSLGQDALVEAVAQANPRTTVVVNAGASITMPWRDRVGAILVAHFPGQEAGTALARVLSGTAEPGGRLPATWFAHDDAGFPSTQPVDGVLRYDEGAAFGYRARTAPDAVAYPFGHGLGFTEWRRRPASGVWRDDALEVRLQVANTGARAGAQLVQLYAEVDPVSAADSGLRFLGAARVQAAAGETVDASVAVSRRAVERVLSPVPPRGLRIGFSSADLDPVEVVAEQR